MQILSFVSAIQYGCWSRELKSSIGVVGSSLSAPGRRRFVGEGGRGAGVFESPTTTGSEMFSFLN